MKKRAIIIDCDPGLDDAINLLLALASSQECHLLGITTVAGNVGLDLTQQICDYYATPVLSVNWQDFRRCRFMRDAPDPC